MLHRTRFEKHPLLQLAALLWLCPLAGPAADWVDLTNGRDLDGWEVIGDGLWTVMKDGTILGQRTKGALRQSWLYTKREFEQFDLALEYWTRLGGNSGVSIRDTSRARWACGVHWVADKTPSHIGYEIQIAMTPDGGKYPSGSIYLFAPAKAGLQRLNDWNLLEIESRHDRIRVRLNGQLAAEHPGDPKRSKRGPIGLQLHDPASLVMFRNIRIRELP